MKNLALCIMSVIFLMTFNPTMLKATAEGTPIANATNHVIESTDVKAMTDRIYEIKSMDKSQLSSTEKRELRVELQGIKKELRHMNGHGGIYISVGGLIIIILLLIILL